MKGRRRWKKIEHLNENKNALALHDRVILKQILIHDKELHWRQRFLTGDLRVHAVLETKHIICELMKVKRIQVGGVEGTCTYPAGLCRCDHCSTTMSIPDKTCPCCGWQLRRNDHWKSQGKVANIKRRAHEM